MRSGFTVPDWSATTRLVQNHGLVENSHLRLGAEERDELLVEVGLDLSDAAVNAVSARSDVKQKLDGRAGVHETRQRVALQSDPVGSLRLGRLGASELSRIPFSGLPVFNGWPRGSTQSGPSLQPNRGDWELP